MAKRSRTAADRAEEAARLRTRPARARMLAAARELATANGYESIKAGHIAAAAGVSRETFYTHFADKRSCLAEATGPRLGEIEAELRIAAEEQEPWAAPMLASLEAALHDRYGSRTTPRGRIIEAMLDLVAERGYPATRLVDVIKAAHVSYPSFYRHFASKQQCFASACENLVDRLADQLEASFAGEADRAARLIRLAELLAGDPAAARILAIEADRLPPDLVGVGSRSAVVALCELATIPGSESAATRVLLAGAFTELLRSAILSARLDRLPADVALLAPHLFQPSHDVERSSPQPERPTHTPRRRERRGRVVRRTPTNAVGASR